MSMLLALESACCCCCCPINHNRPLLFHFVPLQAQFAFQANPHSVCFIYLSIRPTVALSNSGFFSPSSSSSIVLAVCWSKEIKKTTFSQSNYLLLRKPTQFSQMMAVWTIFGDSTSCCCCCLVCAFKRLEITSLLFCFFLLAILQISSSRFLQTNARSLLTKQNKIIAQAQKCITTTEKKGM